VFVVGLLPAEGHVADLAELDPLRIAGHASKFGLLSVPEIGFNIFLNESLVSGIVHGIQIIVCFTRC
jgi:hypothetical protein